MNDTTRSAIVAGLAILAIGLAAATLDSTVVPERNGPSGPDGIGGDGDGGLFPVPRTGPTPGETVQIPFLSELLAILAAIVALLVLAYMFIHWRRVLGALIAGIVLFGLLYALFQGLSPPARVPQQPMPEPGNGSIFGGGGGGGNADRTQPTPPSVILLLVLGLALLGAVGALLRTRQEDHDDPSGETDIEATNAAAVGRAAGRAADRLEETSETENEVYRTWREMTELLSVDDPGTSTPGEFAAAAVDAGLGREDVAELTRLFEDVRYGETSPSEEHERRAIAVFRRIENRYAEDDL